MERKKGLTGKTPLKARAKKRLRAAGLRTKRLRSGSQPKGPLELPAYRAWMRQQVCICYGRTPCLGDVQACHIRSRGARGGDEANLYPACLGHHDEQHHGIKTFAAKYELDFRRVGPRYWARYLNHLAAERILHFRSHLAIHDDPTNPAHQPGPESPAGSPEQPARGPR